MTDEEALKEIDRQEKRLAAAKCGRGLRLVGSAREYYETMIGLRKEAAESEEGCVAAKRKAEELVASAEKAEAEGRMKIAEAKKLRSRAVQYRRIVKDGECLKNQEHMARIRFEEKVRCLVALEVEPRGTEASQSGR